MHSCVYEGWVRHRRFEPVDHQFRYRIYMMYLDLEELPQVFDPYWLWSARRPCPVLVSTLRTPRGSTAAAGGCGARSCRAADRTPRHRPHSSADQFATGRLSDESCELFLLL